MGYQWTPERSKELQEKSTELMQLMASLPETDFSDLVEDVADGARSAVQEISRLWALFERADTIVSLTTKPQADRALMNFHAQEYIALRNQWLGIRSGD